MDYYPPLAILSEVEEALNKHSEDDIEWITFVGSGEPSLHASLGWLIRRVKELTKLPVAVITNGTFLYLKYHRQELAAADAVLPSTGKSIGPTLIFLLSAMLKGLRLSASTIPGNYGLRLCWFRG
jgi:organic radical activating enzyme